MNFADVEMFRTMRGRLHSAYKRGRIAVLASGEVGRFGWKAATSDVRAQSAVAFAEDMGITSPDRPREDVTPAQADALARLRYVLVFPRFAFHGGGKGQVMYLVRQARRSGWAFRVWGLRSVKGRLRQHASCGLERGRRVAQQGLPHSLNRPIMPPHVHLEVFSVGGGLELHGRTSVERMVALAAGVRKTRKRHAGFLEVRGLSDLGRQLSRNPGVFLTLLRKRDVLHEERELPHGLLGYREVPAN